MNTTMIIDGLAIALFAVAAVHLPEIIVFLDQFINAKWGEYNAIIYYTKRSMGRHKSWS